MDRFENGCSFTENERGQKIDVDGFATSSLTYITNRRTCVSVKMTGDKIQIRDTKDVGKTTLTFNPDEWESFIKGVKNGEFDI